LTIIIQKNLEKGAFLGCSEMSGILRSGPHFEKPTYGTFYRQIQILLIKTEKRNGIARRNWTFIFVHFSKVPIKVCNDPL
jgi:hypothetical protein